MRRTWTIMVLAACCAAAWGQGDEPASGIRGLFSGEDAGELPEDAAGRLGLLLVEEGSARQVDVDHAFRTGDQLRLEVTSSRDGWLWVLHRPPGKETEVLWPAEQDDGGPRGYRIAARQKLVVPPPPTVIEFDEDIGREHLYLAITSEARVPRPGAEAGGEKEIVDFSVRGLRLAAEKSMVFDPEDGDPHLYFSTPPSESGVLAAIDLRLRHE